MQKAGFWLPLPQYFTATGRISRLQFLVHVLIAFAAFRVLSVIAVMIGQAVAPARGHLVAAAVTTLLAAYLYFCLYAKRLHDLNGPAVIAALVLSEPAISALMNLGFSLAEYHPQGIVGLMILMRRIWGIVFVVVVLILLLVPGNRGDNRYGADPLLPPAPPADLF